MQNKRGAQNKMYKFRPFEITKVDYKCYSGHFDKGINSYPKPRSGHRIVCNDSDIYCFGGFNPDIVMDRRRRTATPLLFQELWKFDTFTKKWLLLFGPRDSDEMPQELASNALLMKEDMIVVSLKILIQFRKFNHFGLFFVQIVIRWNRISLWTCMF